LIDLKAGARELGIVPRNREEILWLRKLREPSRDDFWSQAVKAVQSLPPQRRVELELRDLPILVSASLYEPDLVSMPASELQRRVQEYLKTQKRHVQESNYDGFADQSRQMLSDFRDELTWGDCAAMLMAVRAMQVPEVVDHLFHYAERDRVDTSTEYGGVIALDGKDRFEVREFQPVMRRHDQEFLASQAMLDAAYTSLFHFHFHAQNHRNEQYAGPGFGDVNYADNTRANCLVFIFMNKNVMNVDYYRHGRVVVDLGEIHRPSGVKPQSTQGAQSNLAIWRFGDLAIDSSRHSRTANSPSGMLTSATTDDTESTEKRLAHGRRPRTYFSLCVPCVLCGSTPGVSVLDR
jgi:hypothetical protein